MVIEYAGELIRSTLTDKRERYYDGRGIGCYMFKIDENLVVDATMRGNAARFINHACEVCHLQQRRPDTVILTIRILFAAQLLLESRGHSRTQAHHHICSATHRSGRGADVRLQVPIRGHQDSVLVWLAQVPQVLELDRFGSQHTSTSHCRQPQTGRMHTKAVDIPRIVSRIYNRWIYFCLVIVHISDLCLPLCRFLFCYSIY